MTSFILQRGEIHDGYAWGYGRLLDYHVLSNRLEHRKCKGMLSADEAIQSFLVRIWVEEEGIEASDDGMPVWRGHITHVTSGYRQHIHDLDQIQQFILAHLREVGGFLPD